jgi:hypothetical protein
MNRFNLLHFTNPQPLAVIEDNNTNLQTMNYFQYLFSDRKGRTYWIIYYSVLFLILFVNSLMYASQLKHIKNPIESVNFSIFDLIFYFFIFFAFPLFYSFSFIKYSKQQRFLKKYSSLITDNSIRSVSVVINQGNYQMTALKSNRFVTINPAPKIDTFTIAEIEDNLVILGQCYTFGVFREHLRPLLINLGDKKKIVDYEFAKIANDYTISVKENDLEVDFKKPIFDIKKLKIKDWKQ